MASHLCQNGNFSTPNYHHQMNFSTDYPWEAVHGIDSDGPSIKAKLDEFLKGGLLYEEQIELLVDLCRDGAASTAGYAAIPLLLCSNAPSPRAAWEMARMAGLILEAVGHEGSPPVPVELAANVGSEAREKACNKLLQTIALAKLGVAELIDSLAVVMALMDRIDLSNQFSQIALKEYGVGL
jgi:hypothetical protein